MHFFSISENETRTIRATGSSNILLTKYFQITYYCTGEQSLRRLGNKTFFSVTRLLRIAKLS